MVVRDLGKWLNKLPKPIGILAATDKMSMHVVAAADNLSLSIPGDVAVIGVDNETFFCDNTSPALSSISLGFENAGFLTVIRGFCYGGITGIGRLRVCRQGPERDHGKDHDQN